MQNKINYQNRTNTAKKLVVKHIFEFANSEKRVFLCHR